MSPQPQRPSPSQDRHAYIPEHVQQAMTKQVEQMMPAHMKQYVGAYVQQNMVNAPGGQAMGSGKVSGPPPGYKPVNHLPRTDHFHQYKAQTPSKADTFIAPDQAAPPQPQQSYDQYQQTPQTPNYDFIINPGQIETPKKGLPGGPLAKVVIFGGGFVALLVLFSLLKGVLSGGSNLPYYTSVIQDQQALIHITGDPATKQNLNTTNRNFAMTANLSLASSQSDLVSLISKSGKKINSKQFGLKISSKTDEQLSASITAGTYNETFKQVSLDQLNQYKSDLNNTYNHTKSAKAQAILVDQYKQADLLITQLSAGDPVASN